MRKALLVLGLIAVCSLRANASVVLTFEGLKDESVNDFYNGGFGGNGSGPGPNLGVSFTSNAQAFIQDEAGGLLNATGLPSPVTAMVFLTGNAATMDVPVGFTDGFSFFYSAIGVGGIINVWSGLDSTGNLLATVRLPVTPSEVGTNPVCNSTGDYCPFFPIDVSFPGTAMSVDFGGTADTIIFDDITLGISPLSGVPEPPPTLALLGFGTALVAFRAMRRLAKAAD